MRGRRFARIWFSLGRVVVVVVGDWIGLGRGEYCCV